MKHIFFIFAISVLMSCEAQVSRNTHSINQSNSIDSAAMILSKRFSPPIGFERSPIDSSGFGFYLRHLPLKEQGSIVEYFDGRLKTKQNVYCAVIDQDIDPVDLQQCADAVMRLRGEYLFGQKKFDQICFNFVSDNKPHYFKDYANGDYSYKKFRSYMKYVFNYANTGSLKNQLVKVDNFENLEIGDVFIQSGTPYGHAVIVVDVAQNENGEKVFLLAQSYMPAQETQLLINPNDPKISPWYSAQTAIIQTPEWKFYQTDLRRFK